VLAQLLRVSQNSLNLGHVAVKQHGFRVGHATHLIEVVKRWQVSADDLLSGVGLSQEALADPRARLPIPTWVALLERARLLSGEPAIGLYIGLHSRPTLYGYLGFALMSASTVREAIELSVRYGPTVTTALSVRLRVDKRVASLIVDEHADFGSARDIIIIATLVALRQISKTLTGRELSTSVADFALPRPDYSGKLGVCGMRLNFDQPVHRLSFDARSLDLPYIMPDRASMLLARDQCQRELDAFGLNGRVVERVRGLISSPQGGCRSLEEVAAELHQSTRTLKRQLATHGASFSTLRDDELRERALVLLRSSELTLTEIALRLGYSNVTNFERAFRRWTTTSPAEWRRTGDRVDRA
jgi:AraC-like DNA-binding protein